MATLTCFEQVYMGLNFPFENFATPNVTSVTNKETYSGIGLFGTYTIQSLEVSINGHKYFAISGFSYSSFDSIVNPHFGIFTPSSMYWEFAQGFSGDDRMTGSKHGDSLAGYAGNDSLIGNAGNDLLDGGDGADSMDGGVGNDTFVVNQLGDKVSEQANQGIDTVLSSLSYTLGSNLENLTLTGNAKINGAGNSLSNVMSGNTASNQLAGGAGNDTLNGGLGADALTGGPGNDVFQIDSAPGGSNVDTIKDFAPGRDRLYFDDAVFAKLGATGRFSAADGRFWASAAGVAHDPSDRIVYDTDGGVLMYDADGNGAGAAVKVAALPSHPLVNAVDIWVL
jgi:Ca2+-binding RTX toxin-like protein